MPARASEGLCMYYQPVVGGFSRLVRLACELQPDTSVLSRLGTKRMCKSECLELESHCTSEHRRTKGCVRSCRWQTTTITD